VRCSLCFDLGDVALDHVDGRRARGISTLPFKPRI